MSGTGWSALKVNKHDVVRQIIGHLEEERSLLFRAAVAARSEATDEQSKAENKYDTRGLEASYLARGQARKVKEVEAAIQEFEALHLRDLGPDEPIQLGAIIELKSRKNRSVYFLGPRAGGLEIQDGNREILVITPQSPLGQQLNGKRQGTRVILELDGERQEFDIVSIL